MLFQQFLGKPIVVSLWNGAVKRGQIVRYDDEFLIVDDCRDGETLIRIRSISDIREWRTR